MRTLLTICGLAAAAACASSGSNGLGSVGGGDQDANVTRVRIGDVSLQADGRTNDSTVWYDVKAPLALTWQYLPIAYKKLGLSITRYDSTQHIIEGERLRSHGDFGGQQLTSLMDCGNVEGMPNASRFDINIETRTVVNGDARRSAVASSVIASAKPSGVAGVLSPCVVNGGAATRVAAAVNDVAKTAIP